MNRNFAPLSFLRPAGVACAHLLWPRRCAACEGRLVASTHSFCIDCAATLRPNDPNQVCPGCALPWRERDVPHRDAAIRRRCSRCRRWPPALSRIFAPYEYGGALADAIIRLKWQDRDDLAGPLADLLLPTLRRCAPPYDAVVPVPLHPQRLRQRGYNQSVLLARAALRSAEIDGCVPLRPRLLRRLRPDAPARDMGLAQRFARVRDAFAVEEGAAIRGQRLLLLDDVITTGATVLACAGALTAAGAAQVDALALARVC